MRVQQLKQWSHRDLSQWPIGAVFFLQGPSTSAVPAAGVREHPPLSAVGGQGPFFSAMEEAEPFAHLLTHE